MQGPRQEKRWSEIQANGPDFVKPGPGDPLAGIRAQVAFPILAVAPSARHVGIACLDGRLRAIVARSHRVRDRVTAGSIIRAAVAGLEHEIAQRTPGTVVIEGEFGPGHATLAQVLADELVRRARESDTRVVRLSLAAACVRITGAGDARETALVLLGRYQALRKRLAPAGAPLLHHERWREAKPLMTAFALAHAVALEVLTTSARPLGMGPPPPP